jgi:hypothetical protein
VGIEFIAFWATMGDEVVFSASERHFGFVC